VAIVELRQGARRRRSLFGRMAAVLISAAVAACSGSTATWPAPSGSSSATASAASPRPTAGSPTTQPSPIATPFPFDTPAASPILVALDHAPVLPAGVASRIDWYRGPRLDTCVEKTAADGTILGYCPEYKLFSWSKGYIIFAETDIPITDSSGGLVADQYAIAVWSSPDGLHWTGPRKIWQGYVSIQDVEEGPAGLLAIGYYNGPGAMGGGPEQDGIQGLWRSADGITWSSVSMTHAFGDLRPEAISGGPRGYIATGVGPAPLVWISDDGLRWTSSELPFAIYRSGLVRGPIAFAGGYLLYGEVFRPGGDGGDLLAVSAVWSTSAGSSWKREVLPGVVADYNASTWAEKLSDSVLLAAETVPDATGRGSIEYDWTSTDGRTWTPFDLGPIKGQTWTFVANGRQALVVVDQWDDTAGEITGVAWYALGSDLRLTRLIGGPGDPTFGKAAFVLGPTGLVAMDGAQVIIGVVS
jgi:hypothetical protein